MKTVIDLRDPVDGAAEALGVILERHKHLPVLLLLSGGSALTILDRLPDSVFGPMLSIAMLDERWSDDENVNNFAQLRMTNFYNRREEDGAKFFDSRPHFKESATDLAARYENFLHTWRMVNPDGIVIATLGMGTDGHTAGIFPGYVGALDNAAQWVTAYEVPVLINQYTVRITVTPRFLANEIDNAVALVVGVEKRAVLARLSAATNPEQYPAALWYRLQKVSVLTDS